MVFVYFRVIGVKISDWETIEHYVFISTLITRIFSKSASPVARISRSRERQRMTRKPVRCVFIELALFNIMDVMSHKTSKSLIFIIVKHPLQLLPSIPTNSCHYRHCKISVFYHTLYLFEQKSLHFS